MAALNAHNGKPENREKQVKLADLGKVLPAVAQFRKLNGSYTASAATKQECEAALAIMGGAVQMDRVLNKVAGHWDNLAYQIEEHIKAVISLFHYTLINGDAVTSASTDEPQFEGLDFRLRSIIVSAKYFKIFCFGISYQCCSYHIPYPPFL